MAGASKPMANASSKGKGKEIISVEEDSKPEVLGRRRRGSNATQAAPRLPICKCRDEHTKHRSVHRAFETLVIGLHNRFQQHERHVFDVCCKILHQFTVGEMAGRVAFDRLNCILVNEPSILKEATRMFTVYMSLGECLKRHRDIEPMDPATIDKILDSFGY